MSLPYILYGVSQTFRTSHNFPPREHVLPNINLLKQSIQLYANFSPYIFFVFCADSEVSLLLRFRSARIHLYGQEESGEKSKNEVEKMEKSPTHTLKYTQNGEKSMEKSGENGEKWRKVEKSGEMPSQGWKILIVYIVMNEDSFKNQYVVYNLPIQSQKI